MGSPMRPSRPLQRAFTLIELLVVLGIIAILASLLLPTLGRAKGNALRTNCASNLKQVNLAIQLYADEHAGSLPVLPNPNPYPNGVGAFYKQLVKGYVGLTGPASPDERVFVCPADRIFSRQAGHAFGSYTFNGYEVGPADLPRITGQKLGAIGQPTRAVLVGEWPAFFGGSWHPITRGDHPDLRNILSFVDGHVAFTRIFWNGVTDSNPCNYEPPANYDYDWDGR